ncbi:MAG: MMPL family transporter, partial [Thermoleophilaceae bacterium]|nr:MMPL family transporter [Thermoleophilaceae bacterium]
MESPRNIAARAGRWSALHRRKAIVGWLAFVIVAVFIGGSVGTKTLGDDDYQIGESGRADAAISDHFPDKEDESVLVQSQNGATNLDPEFRRTVETVVAKLEETRHVRNVQSPYAEGGQGTLSEDGKSGLVTFEIPGENAEDKVDPALATVSKLDRQAPEFRIEEFGGASADKALSQAFEDDFQKAEVTSLPITLIILILAFGALLAAFVPLVLAITAVAAAIGLIGPISQLWPVEETINSVVLLIGLAVGVDYSLFYLRREREERARGRSEEAALEAAAATSGRAVLVSGFTVIAAMAGMYLGGAATFVSFATGTILVVAISVVGSLTVLPAVLSWLGDRVNKGRVPFLRPERRTGEPRAWSWVLDRVLRRPLVSAIAAGAVLVALAIPVLHIHTADTGVDGLPRSLEVMQTYDRMQAAFPGEQFTADIVLEGKNLDRSQIQAAAQELRQVARDSDHFYEPITVDRSPDGEVAVIEVPLAGTGTDETSMAAVETLREDVVPRVFPSVSGGEVVGVSGFTAGSVDFNELMSSRIWWVFGFVFTVAFVLLLVTFRSIVIPIKAIALNALSVAAAMGIVTYVFQDGHFEDLLGFDSTGAITSWFPLMLFVILFGLSMDYHVFILSRIKEAVDRGASTEDAVSHGIKSTAGVVSAAAIVMVAVFSIFATLSFIDMKQFGVGLAAAVLIDATLVRGVLLPAVMKLLGKWNWYLPSWLEWLPKGPALDAEGLPAAPAPAGDRRGAGAPGPPPAAARSPPKPHTPPPRPPPPRARPRG